MGLAKVGDRGCHWRIEAVPLKQACRNFYAGNIEIAARENKFVALFLPKMLKRMSSNCPECQNILLQIEENGKISFINFILLVH